MSPIRSRRPSARSGTAACRRRWPRASSTASSALLLALAGCGGDGAQKAALPADVGEALAGHAADVHERLDAGDAIGARAEAAELAALSEDAIARADVPPELAPELRRGTARLQELVAAAVSAAPSPPPTAPEDAEPAEEDGKNKKKGKGDGNKDEEEEKKKEKDEDRGDGDDGDDD